VTLALLLDRYRFEMHHNSMRGSFRAPVLRCTLLVLYVLASLSLPLAHRPIQAAIPAELAQYVLPDGTLPVICGQALPGAPGQGQKRAAVCDACCLMSAPGLPPAADAAFILPTASVRIAPMAELDIHYAVLVASLGARGPPSL
jgi:hypothetical protein